jgi:ABC-2 type transport system ATP-binding protein
MSTAIHTEQLARTYRGGKGREAIRAVDGVDLEVEQGAVLGLLGPNGAGKTTMVRMLSCLLHPTEGTARICGYDVREDPGKVRALCGVSPEAPGLYERLTAENYLAFFGRLYRVRESELGRRIEAQLRTAELWDRRGERLGSFSKGMRQKVNIARALLHRPRVVFLDEPTSGLDVEAARAIREHIQQLSQDAETTFFICTHNLPEAERLCSRIAVMNRGRIVATGTPEELKGGMAGERTLRAHLRAAAPGYQEAAARVAGVSAVEAANHDLLIKTGAPEAEVNPRVVRALVEAGAEIIAFTTEGRTLEDVYLHLVHQEAEEVQA